MGSIDMPTAAENGSAPTASTAADGSFQTGHSNGTLGDDSNVSKKKRAGILPLEVGTRVMCRWRDGKFHPVKVIERRKLSLSGVNDYEYYVHYTEFNRRLDEWVKLEQLDLDSVEAVVYEKVEDK